MSQKPAQVFDDVLHSVFDALDGAPVGPKEMFRSESEKERYESLCFFSVRRYQAASYHYDRVLTILEEHQSRVAPLRSVSLHWPDGTNVTNETTITGLLDTSSLEFEFSAFHACIKSALDFLALVAMKHLGGVQGDSISHLMRLVGRGCSGPLLEEVAAALTWLEQVRSYRDHLLHRLLVNLYAGYRVDIRGEHRTHVVYPVLVPSETPRFVADTRQTRMFALDADGPPNTVVSESRMMITYPDGREEMREHLITAEPLEGYRPIEEHMRLDLQAHTDFTRAVLGRIAAEGMTVFPVRANRK